MSFKLTPNMRVRYDDAGILRNLRQFQDPFRSEQAKTPLALAAAYFREAQEHFKFPRGILKNLEQKHDPIVIEDHIMLRFHNEKTIQNTTVLAFSQYYRNIPVWGAGLSAIVNDSPLRLTSATNSVHYKVAVKDLKPGEGYSPKKVNPDSLLEFLLEQGRPIAEKNPFLKQLLPLAEKFRITKVTQARHLIYRYESENRIDPEQRAPRESIDVIKIGLAEVPLQPVPKDIREGNHYLVTDILFTLDLGIMEPINFRIFIEPQSKAVLYARMLVAHADALVYRTDPPTKGSAVVPTSPAVDLDALRDNVTLLGLTPGGPPQDLTGEFVYLTDISAPSVAPPTSAADFNYSVPTDNFSAANAYYHSDALFRMLQDFGYTVATYFDGTTFPVRVDHRATVGCAALCSGGNCKNASAPGNATSDGSDGFRYALVEANTSVGMSTAWRVVLHEFGHSILWDHVDSPNFGFAHSPGDSMGVIMNDPGTLAPDRFLSFPWATIGRRHDRAIGAGWAWGGTQDTGGYNSEQILSTTLFRLYRYVGGDGTWWGTAFQEFVARTVVNLIFKSVSFLTPATNPADAEAYADELIDADLAVTSFEGTPGGALHKVVRWSFEKQGSYQLPGAPSPVVTEGAAPLVDVYIDDGRTGEYAPLLSNWWNTSDIWNRQNPDGGLTHESPIVGTTNYMYVRISNRGSNLANNVVVRGYQCNPGVGLIWPTTFTPWDTPAMSPIPGTLAAGGTVIVGPFNWTPTTAGHECILAMVDADGDMANSTTVLNPITLSRFVPFDNNIGQRNMAPIAGGGGGGNLTGSMEHREGFNITNPLEETAEINMDIQVDPFLWERGWRFGLEGIDPQKPLRMKAKDTRKVRFKVLQKGKDFSRDAVAARKKPIEINFHATANGFPIGGMTYYLDPGLEKIPTERKEDTGGGGTEKPGCNLFKRKS